MPAGKDKLKLAGAWLAEQGDRAGPETFFPGVVFDLLENLLGILRAVHVEEDLADHSLLVRGEILADTLLGDVPVVIDLRSERMLERKNGRLFLFFGQALV